MFCFNFNILQLCSGRYPERHGGSYVTNQSNWRFYYFGRMTGGEEVILQSVIVVQINFMYKYWGLPKQT